VLALPPAMDSQIVKESLQDLVRAASAPDAPLGEESAATGVEVRGRVHCREQPVAYAQLVLRQHGGERSVLTDPAGAFVLAVDPWAGGTLTARHGSWSRTVELRNGGRLDDGGRIALQAPVRLRWTIRSRDPDDRLRPIHGAELRLLAAPEGRGIYLPRATAQVIASGRTDAAGEVAFEGLASAPFFLEIEHPDFLPHLSSFTGRIADDPGAEFHFHAELDPRPLAAVQILGPDRAPLAHARLLIGAVYRELETDAVGGVSTRQPWGSWNERGQFTLTQELWIRLPSGRWWCRTPGQADPISWQGSRMTIHLREQPLRAEWPAEVAREEDRVWVMPVPASTNAAPLPRRPDAIGSPAFLGTSWQELRRGGGVEFRSGWCADRLELRFFTTRPPAVGGRGGSTGFDAEGVAVVPPSAVTTRCPGDVVPPGGGGTRTPTPPACVGEARDRLRPSPPPPRRGG
jgi:hypothetical protein